MNNTPETERLMISHKKNIKMIETIKTIKGWADEPIISKYNNSGNKKDWNESSSEESRFDKFSNEESDTEIIKWSVTKQLTFGNEEEENNDGSDISENTREMNMKIIFKSNRINEMLLWSNEVDSIRNVNNEYISCNSKLVKSWKTRNKTLNCECNGIDEIDSINTEYNNKYLKCIHSDSNNQRNCQLNKEGKGEALTESIREINNDYNKSFNKTFLCDKRNKRLLIAMPRSNSINGIRNANREYKNIYMKLLSKNDNSNATRCGTDRDDLAITEINKEYLNNYVKIIRLVPPNNPRNQRVQNMIDSIGEIAWIDNKYNNQFTNCFKSDRSSQHNSYNSNKINNIKDINDIYNKESMKRIAREGKPRRITNCTNCNVNAIERILQEYLTRNIKTIKNTRKSKAIKNINNHSDCGRMIRNINTKYNHNYWKRLITSDVNIKLELGLSVDIMKRNPLNQVKRVVSQGPESLIIKTNISEKDGSYDNSKNNCDGIIKINEEYQKEYIKRIKINDHSLSSRLEVLGNIQENITKINQRYNEQYIKNLNVHSNQKSKKIAKINTNLNDITQQKDEYQKRYIKWFTGNVRDISLKSNLLFSECYSDSISWFNENYINRSRKLITNDGKYSVKLDKNTNEIDCNTISKANDVYLKTYLKALVGSTKPPCTELPNFPHLILDIDRINNEYKKSNYIDYTKSRNDPEKTEITKHNVSSVDNMVTNKSTNSETNKKRVTQIKIFDSPKLKFRSLLDNIPRDSIETNLVSIVNENSVLNDKEKKELMKIFDSIKKKRRKIKWLHDEPINTKEKKLIFVNEIVDIITYVTRFLVRLNIIITSNKQTKKNLQEIIWKYRNWCMISRRKIKKDDNENTENVEKNRKKEIMRKAKEQEEIFEYEKHKKMVNNTIYTYKWIRFICIWIIILNVFTYFIYEYSK